MVVSDDFKLDDKQMALINDLLEVVEKHECVIQSSNDGIFIGGMQVNKISLNQKTGLGEAHILHPQATTTGFKQIDKRGIIVTLDEGQRRLE
jgi:hypothetical protein